MSIDILHIVGDSKYGGGSLIVARLAEQAAACGHAVAVLTTDPAFGEVLSRCGVEAVELDCIWRPVRPLRDCAGLLRLERYLRKERYDVVHTHTSKAGFVGRLAASRAGVRRIVHTVHGFAFHERTPTWKRTPIVALERIAARHCHRIVTVSEYHRRWALELGIAEADKVVAIPNGIAPERVEERCGRVEVRSELNLDQAEVAFLCLGRLAAGKGLEDLIAAVERLDSMESLPPFRVLLPGDGPLRDVLRHTIAERGLDNRISLLGFRNDVGDLLAAADAVVLPTYREGLSISLLEAMAAGKPIITTDIGSNLEATGDGATAVIIPVGDVGELASAMRRIMEAPEGSRQLGRAALARYRSLYTEERMVRQYMDLYEELCERPEEAPVVA